MIYAILTPGGEAPLGYYSAVEAPTPEELADHMAREAGCVDRDEWIERTGVGLIGYAPVH